MVAKLPVRIPVIDLRHYRSADLDAHQAFVKTLGDGLKEFGFVSIEGHGVDQSLIEEVYDLFKAFYALDPVVKQAYEGATGGERGYTSFGKEHAKDQKLPDLKEFWHVGQELPADHPLAAVYTPNVWPSEIPGLRDKVMQLYNALQDSSYVMLQALAEYFELPINTFSDMVKDGNHILRAIHYPPLGPEAPDGAVRAAAHEDINMITILCEATSSGLEILTHDGEWVAIEALSGQFVVDSGDMLARVTNGVIPATTHRVVNPPSERNTERYSLPFFVHPYPDCDLTVLPAFTGADNPAKWPPITADQFLKQRLREIGLLKEN